MIEVKKSDPALGFFIMKLHKKYVITIAFLKYSIIIKIGGKHEVLQSNK